METQQVAASVEAAREALGGDLEAELVIAFGRAFHQSGVPSDQLEELMRGTALALDIELQVTALPTSITAAIGHGYAQKVVLLRLEPGIIDLRRLSLLNAVYERVLRRRVACPDALKDVERIARLPHAVGPLPTVFAYLVLSLGASIILGGRELEHVASGLVGLAVGLVAVLGRRNLAIARLFDVLAAFVTTVIVSTFAARVHPIAVYVPLVAGVVQLVPGLQITAALHELAYRNLVAGTARLGGVLMTLVSLGCGFALGIAVVGPTAMHVAPVRTYPLSPLAIALATLAIATAIAILQNARAADIPWVIGSCAVAEVAYRIAGGLPGHQVATFGAALVVGLFTGAGARYARIPQAVLLIPGVLILVPGALSYESVLYLLQSDAGKGGALAVNAGVAASEIVAGLLLAQLFVSPRALPGTTAP